MPISFDPNKSFLNRAPLPREIAPAGELVLAVGVGIGVSFFATPLAGAAAASLAVLLAGCGSDKKTTNSPNSAGQTGGGNPANVAGDTSISCTSDEECMAPEHCVAGACTTLPTADDDVPADGGISADDDIPADDDDAPTAEEICNDLDEDGDGQTDESSASTPGQPIPLERTSGSGDGECRPVTEKCIRGEWVPLEPRRVEKPVETSCDDLDNDCDGETDEDFGTATCGIGACEKTIDNCVRGAFLLCDPMKGASDELCSDQIDNNCDGSTDEESAVDAPTWYRDADADAFGSSLESIKQCLQPSEFVANPLDCNDDNPYLNPASSEDCDGLDTNCTTPLGLADVATEIDNDGDGYIECDPFIDHGAVLTGGGDCDDSKIAVNPAAVEICDSIDNNCDALTDDPSAADAQTWFADADHDNFGNPNISEVACSAPANHVPDNTDCNDDNSGISPGAAESCNTVDDDCDGTVDELNGGVAVCLPIDYYCDQDGDTYYSASPSDQVQGETCTAGLLPAGCQCEQGDDCRDTNDEVNPGVLSESCNGIDDNCDARVDEGNICSEKDYYCDADGDDEISATVTDQVSFFECTARALTDARILDCSCTAGLDCQDGDDSITSTSTEDCDDGINNDCTDARVDCEDPACSLDTSCGDEDGDGSLVTEDCNDADDTIYPSAPEICDGLDNDCDTDADEGFPNDDGDTFGNSCDPCLNDPLNDADGDTFCGNIDICELGYDSVDDDDDGVPNACDSCPATPRGLPAITTIDDPQRGCVDPFLTYLMTRLGELTENPPVQEKIKFLADVGKRIKER